jgi:hypothetical protein
VSRILQSSKTDEWLTPPDVLDRIRSAMPIALDPCASPLSFVDAAWGIVAPDQDGLSLDWQEQILITSKIPWTFISAADVARGCAFVNPPYSDLRAWLAKCAAEAAKGVPVVGLVPARLESQAFQDHVLGKAWLYAVRGRLNFHRAIEVEYDAELAKQRPRLVRLRAIEDAAYAGALTYPSDSATFASVLIEWDRTYHDVPSEGPIGPCQYKRGEGPLMRAFPEGLLGRWIR